MISKVAVIRVKPEADEMELLAALEEAINLLGGLKQVCTQSDRVLVKPNYGAGVRRNCVNPKVTSAVLALFSKNGNKTIIGENSGGTSEQSEKWQNRVFNRLGLKDICDKHGAEWVDFRNGQHRTVRVPDPLFFDEIVISEYALDVDVIVSLAKMKVVNICSVSLSLKNMKGVLPSFMKRRFHCEGLNMGIVDLYKVVKPRLAIIDGTYAMDQVAGKEQPVGLLITSYDCVAADAISSKVMGFDPRKIDHLALAERVGLGVADEGNIEIVGEALPGLIGKYTFSIPRNPFDLAKESGGGIEIIQGQPCSSCLNELGNELFEFKGKLNQFRSVKILVGPSVKIPEGENTVIFY